MENSGMGDGTRGSVDLNICDKGDILISVHGDKLKYVSPTTSEYLDHIVEYEDKNLGNGSRTNDGYVFKYNRLETDHDIVKIIKK